MAAIRLTNDTRDLIVKRLIEHGFGKRGADLREEALTLGEEVYARVYSEKHRKAMASLPSGFMDEDNTISVYVGGESHRLPLRESRRVAHKYDERRLSILATDDLGTTIAKHKRQYQSFKSDRDEAERKARAVAASVTSLGRLLEIWPEIESFTGDIAANGSRVTSLAVPIKTLNKTLGLPPGKKAA